ncbi:MAG: hypothetical protein RI907_3180 [Pseudomonadota bacterium]|jgi:MSHA biogenesis protein MshO
MMRQRLAPRGFTLIEVIMVIVSLATLAAAFAVFIRPAVDAYVGSSSRADMSIQLDGTLRRMLRDVRRAVPNSLRTPGEACFQLVPAIAGGRYRVGPDRETDADSCFPQPTPPTAPATSCTAWVDPSQPTMVFDVLSPMSVVPTAAADFVVINNQNGNDVYNTTSDVNRSGITAYSAYAAASTMGESRLTINTMQVSPGYTAGRFQVVSGNEPSVFYFCEKSSGSGDVDSNGDGRWTLFRAVLPFDASNANYPSACPTTASVTAVPVATRLTRCTFVYNPNQGATQQSGYIWMKLEMSRRGESAALIAGGHVMNVP